MTAKLLTFGYFPIEVPRMPVSPAVLAERFYFEVWNQADEAVARKGLHRGRFFGVEPTGKEITWAGGAFFTINGEQIVELWVLGDVDSVKQQLNAPKPAAFSSAASVTLTKL